MINTPDYIGHRKRIKDKYLSAGLDGWHDYEILEYALGYAIPRRDIKPIAKKLIEKFKTIDKVLNADTKELKTIKGISDHTALFLRFLKDISIIYFKNELLNKDLLSSPGLVVNYLKVYLKGSANEEFNALFLNKGNKLISLETIQKGTIDRSAVYPRKIVERALYHHAVNVIVAHNHPGESIKPSKNDIEVTKAIADALNTIDIKLLDHIIIGGNNYFSFKEHNLI
ncbi:MAG: DNA repair protein RadC [Endomicrobiales bacterium]|nr:DNA repair protein RadC [Endomicrobiales bacterium]